MSKAAGLIVTNSGNWTRCPPLYLYVLLHGLWHLKMVLLGSLAFGFCWTPALRITICTHMQSLLVLSKGGQQQRNLVHLQQT